MMWVSRRLILWILVAALLGSTPAQAQSEAGTVAAVVGTLQVRRARIWQNASIGVPVFPGDRLRTGPNDQAKIVFRDDSVLDLAPATVLTVDTQVFDPASHRFASLLRVAKGKIRCWVSEYYRHPRARYEVETPTAIARVGGTEFVVLHDSTAGFTDIVGVDGTVEVVGKLAVLGGAVRVGPRAFTRVERGRFPTGAEHLNDARFRRYLSGLEIVGTGGRDGLDVQHPAVNGRLLAAEDVPGRGVPQRKTRAPARLILAAPTASLVQRMSPDIATNTQPLLGFRSTPPGKVPAGSVKVGF
ncbi:MAG: FecR domain-containing protein [Candidatus Binatia bacterium]